MAHAWVQVDTDYIFHMEDDWVFNRIPGFVQASLSILRSAYSGDEASLSILRSAYSGDEASLSILRSAYSGGEASLSILRSESCLALCCLV
jgi:hypothetical protein